MVSHTKITRIIVVVYVHHCAYDSFGRVKS